MEFLAKHWGDLAGALGFAFTIWLVLQAKTAAEQARDAAQQVRERISALDTIGELSTAITILQEIMRLQRTNAWDTVWDIVLDRYATLRVHLVRSELGTGVSKTHQRSIRTALDQFGIIVQEIESARTSRTQEELDTVRFNRVLSDQIDTLERTRMSVKRQELDMAFPDQIDKLVTRLTELTAQGKVEWQETASLNTYLAPVGKFTVSVGKAGSEVYGGYSFQIFDQGRAVDGALATFGDHPTSAQNWERLRNLHEQARRSALHSGRVVSELLSSLDQIA